MAGFGLQDDDDDDDDFDDTYDKVFNWLAFLIVILYFLVFLLVLGTVLFIYLIKNKLHSIKCLGLLKASVGCFKKKIGNWKYDYLQPQNPFAEASLYV